MKLKRTPHFAQGAKGAKEKQFMVSGSCMSQGTAHPTYDPANGFALKNQMTEDSPAVPFPNGIRSNLKLVSKPLPL